MNLPNKFSKKEGSDLTLTVRRDNESLDSLIKRFKLWVADAGIMDEIRKREFYQSKSIKRKNKSKRARKRLLKESRM